VVGVTADTNIYVSAFIFAGLPRQFILAAEGARIRLSYLRSDTRGAAPDTASEIRVVCG
jgi:hypothetical protein